MRIPVCNFASARALSLLVVLSVVLPPSAVFGQESDFAAVHSVLRRACFECHGPEHQEGDLRLDRPADVAAAVSIVAGRPEDSELIRRITLSKGHDEVMPAIGQTLSKAEVELIRNWIRSGAPWPDSFTAARHWSYIAPVRPPVPDVGDIRWGRNAIDDFVAARLQAEQLTPSVEAPPETLIRRLSFDLTGLPPSPEEVNAFAADPSDEAYLRIVNDLLSRPQFGERWARPWLDLARYADSHGFQRDNLRDIWAYRDWVIQALNDDMPFDRFTIEQIAGDLLPHATESQKIATGFHRCTPTNVEAGSLPEETRIEQVIDRVNTTGAVWLGTTLECCQCHDHKYDPFAAKDYYGLLAFFNSTEAEADRKNPKQPSSIAFKGPSMPVSNAARTANREAMTAQQQTAKAELNSHRSRLSADLETWASEFCVATGNSPRVHPLSLVSFESLGSDDSYRVLDDGSILLIGNSPPEKDRYTISVRTKVKDTVAFQLDVLKHDSLPGKGPGRGDSVRTNFVLTRFTAHAAGREIKFSTATADFSQKGWDVAGTLTDKPKTGWAVAPKFGTDHQARFVLSDPLSGEVEQQITFQLTHDYGGARSIGRLKLSTVTGDLNTDSPPADIAKIARMPAVEWSTADRKTLLDFRIQQAPEAKAISAQIEELKEQIAKQTEDTTLVMIELSEPRMSYVFERGDYRMPGDTITPATPPILHPMADGPPNRLTLAKWLMDPANPLVARVTVNRWWAEVFGQGIVPTVEDFGLKGDAPSHPDLLDWLAVEFVEGGWSMKHVLRTIVTSSTYRQSSAISVRHSPQDVSNRLLARGPSFRMDAETIRDNALAVSGLLNLKQFGPPIRPYQPDGIWSKVGGEAYKYVVSPGSEQHRRGIYVVLKRGAPYPSFINFDASARLACTVKRSRTNTPLQALTLLNDPVYVEAAKSLALRVLSEHTTADSAEQLGYAFQLCTARTPSPHELGILADLLETQRSIGLNDHAAITTLANGTDLPDGVDSAEFSAWCSVATTLLNLHETITKD